MASRGHLPAHDVADGQQEFHTVKLKMFDLNLSLATVIAPALLPSSANFYNSQVTMGVTICELSCGCQQVLILP
jgi:hypothetical protein